MKPSILCLLIGLLATAANAQTPGASSNSPKLDSLTKLVQRFVNDNQPDSLYALMGTTFRERVSRDKMKEVVGQITGQVGKWTSSELQSITNGVAHYKVLFAVATADLLISQDKQGKIETFLLKPL